MCSPGLPNPIGARLLRLAIPVTCAMLFLKVTPGIAQTPMAMPTPTQHAAGAADQNKTLAEQLADLRAQVARLQITQQSAPTKKSAQPGMTMANGKEAGMPMTGDKGEMGAMPQGSTGTADQSRMLADQIADLRAQVASLQAARQVVPMKNAKPGMSMGNGGGMPMPMMDGKGQMAEMPSMPTMPPAGAMSDDKGEMSGMSGEGKGGSPAAAMGMCCMGEMGAMAGGGRPGMGGPSPQSAGAMPGMSTPTSALPGQPGASHLYHIGSTGFFLNHPQHITLTQDQRSMLNRLKEKAMLDRASTQRRLDQAEQELYGLTGMDQPDASRIQAKISEIEKLRSDERMNFIRAVGEATNVLSHEQHLALMGTMTTGRE